MKRNSWTAIAAAACLLMAAGCNPIWTETGPAESAFSGEDFGKSYSPGSLMSHVYSEGEQSLTPKDPLGQTESLHDQEIGRE
ncbi:hypothetical protein [Paenibacillus tarimensis]|uniref:hypothetical protein n=1 Tax=Paenibacillus tarimensis TaxID=416012 RepID=UPI001F3FA6C4|nr:hypothetical protein [Paenibacillus tarimensis]MCF2942158.1 hypothetical protein [Paenibacillus tarimensis]